MKYKHNILLEIKRLIKERDSSAKIYLYGSRAKGNAHKDSDWDILVLLQREKITPEIETEITDPLYELEFETGEVISPMIYTESEWNSRYRVTPFYRNVMMEGKLL